MADQTQTQTQAPWTSPTRSPEPELGLDNKTEKTVVERLEQVHVDTYVTYAKTLNAHWNVTGPMFKPLHDLFEDQYQALFGAIDDVAERIRALGRIAPATLKGFVQRTNLTEWDSPPQANQMITDLVKDHERIIIELRDLSQQAQKAGDDGTVDLIGDRLRAHEEHAWMLRVHLE